MTYKTFLMRGFAVTAIALAVAVSAMQAGDRFARRAPHCDAPFAGEIVSLTENELRLRTVGNEEQSRNIDARTRVSIDGQAARLDDLRQGDTVEVRLGANYVATEINATRQNNATRQSENATPPPPEPARFDAEAPRSARENEGAQQPAQPQRAEEIPRPALEGQAATAEDPQRTEQSQERAVLGVALAPSTGAGVLIPDVAPDGPAAKAGIQRGDYITSIDGQEISSPESLTETLAEKRPGEQVEIRTWRNGQEFDVQVQLVSHTALETQPQSETGNEGNGTDRNSRELNTRESNARESNARNSNTRESNAWIGVILEANETAGEPGVTIDRVYPDGPADAAGVKAGDVLVQVNRQQISEPDEASQAIAELQPGTEAQLVVMRDGQSRTINVTLGDRSAAFQSEGNGDFEAGDEEGEVPEHQMMLEQHRRLAEQHERLEAISNQLLKEVQELRKEVRQLKGATPATE